MSNLTLAEMVNSTNYAAMSYDELVTVNLAFHLAISEVKPLISIRRAEEIAARTHEFAAQMKKYCATKKEVMACLEKESFSEMSYFSSTTQYVDDQSSTAVSGDDSRKTQANGETILLLPEHFECTVDDALAKDAMESADVEDMPAEEEPKTGCSVDPEVKEQSFVDEALSIMRALPAPKNLDENAPYYIECDFSFGDEGELGHSNPRGRNMSMKDLEEFRSATETFVRLFQKKEVITSTEDFLAYNDSLNTFIVRLYHFPDNAGNAADISTQETILTAEEIKELKKKQYYLKKAIKLAKEYSLSDGTDVHTPFYDRYRFAPGMKKSLDLKSDRVRVYEDVANLTELMPAFESYAKLFQEGYSVVTKDNCVAAMRYHDIYVVLFNIPNQEKKRKAPKKSAPKATDTYAQKESVAVTDATPAQGISDLVMKAVEMTKALPVVNGTDGNLPYYLQTNFSVMSDGNLIYSGKPFSQNVSVDGLDKISQTHRKYAKTLKASHIVSTDGYTAFIWNDGKSLTVFDYNVDIEHAA